MWPRLSSVSARSELFPEAVDLEFATGNLLRSQPPATRIQSNDFFQTASALIRYEGIVDTFVQLFLFSDL